MGRRLLVYEMTSHSSLFTGINDCEEGGFSNVNAHGENRNSAADEMGKKMGWKGTGGAERGQRGQLGLTDASCQRPWREGNPPAGKGDDINFDMIVIFCHQSLTSCYCKTHDT